MRRDDMSEEQMHHSEALLWISALEWWIRQRGLKVPTWRDVTQAGWYDERTHKSPTLGLPAEDDSVLRSGGQIHQYGPRPRIATARPRPNPT